jgi:hypothetical protein
MEAPSLLGKHAAQLSRSSRNSAVSINVNDNRNGAPVALASGRRDGRTGDAFNQHLHRVTGNFVYRAFGLTLRSEFPLEGLALGDPAAPTDLVIGQATFGSDCPSEPGLHQWGGGALLSIPRAGRFLCTGGCRIAVERQAHAPPSTVQLFLLGSAMGLILHQRGLLPLHANALEVGAQAIAFMGRSGAGKSTLTAWYAEQGHRIIADDVSVVGMDGAGRPFVQPGLARIRLWRQALENLGGNPEDHPRSLVGDPQYDKFDVAMSASSISDGPVPLRAICLLQFGPVPSVTRLNGIDALEALYENTYRGAFVTVTGAARPHWESCVQLSRTVPVLRTIRPESLSDLGHHARSMIAGVLKATERQA